MLILPKGCNDIMLDVFAKRLAEFMKDENLSQRKLSFMINCQSKSIRYWLSGKYYPRHDFLVSVAELFHVSIDYLLGLVDVEEECLTKFNVDYKKRLIDKLSAYMRTNGITYYKLAKSLDIGQTTLKRWFLNGSMPETTILIRISKLLGERLDDLFGRGISLDG